MLRRTSRRWILGAIAAALTFWVLVLDTPAGDRSGRDFDPDRLAELEVGMWQAYYRKDKVQLGRLLLVALREQFHYSWSKAGAAAFHLGKAAAAFGEARDDYDRVLPDLEDAYAIARAWMGARFDPRAVARDELAWWIARRKPGERAPEHVGLLIGQLYADFYDVPRDTVLAAGVLRARAADLRDQGGSSADWREVTRLLHASYRSLHEAVAHHRDGDR